ncbi:MAG: hypothetical protein AAFN74_12785 [Myxococcota bacterium]
MTSLAAGGLLCAGAFASNAWARPSYLTGIPNSGVNSCGTCHVNPAGGGARNSFGQDVQASLNNGPTWSALFDVDSDSDGQTNGEELGDPCGTWMAGAAAPRTTDISAPGDSASTSADPNTPACANPDAGMGDTGMGDTGMEMDAGMPMDSGTAMDAGVPGSWPVPAKTRATTMMAAAPAQRPPIARPLGACSSALSLSSAGADDAASKMF